MERRRRQRGFAEHKGDGEAGRRTTGGVAAPEEFAARDREDSPPNVNQEVEGRQLAAGDRPAFPDNGSEGATEQEEACRYLGRRLEEVEQQLDRLDRRDGGGEGRRHGAGQRPGASQRAQRLTEVRDERDRVRRLYERLCGGDTENWEALRREVQDQVEVLFEVLDDLLRGAEG